VQVTGLADNYPGWSSASEDHQEASAFLGSAQTCTTLRMPAVCAYASEWHSAGQRGCRPQCRGSKTLVCVSFFLSMYSLSNPKSSYVLERHLLRDQVISQDAHELGKFRGEPGSCTSSACRTQMPPPLPQALVLVPVVLVVVRNQGQIGCG
jgi:hypothetical protein